MAIRFRCPRCLHKLQTVDSFAGKTVNCPHCNRRMSIPAASQASSMDPEDSADTKYVEIVPEDIAAPIAAPAISPTVAPKVAPPRRVEADRRVESRPEPEYVDEPESNLEFESEPEPGADMALARAAIGSVPDPEFAPARRASASARLLEPDAPLLAPSLKIDFEELIDMTAMVDIVFFLLIFFLVTSMHPLDSTIPLPTADTQGGSGGASQTDAGEGSVVVNIDRNDKIQIEGTEVHGHEDLLLKLRDLLRGPGKPEKMLVVGSSEASHGTAVMVLDSGHEVGFTQVQMAVRDEK